MILTDKDIADILKSTASTKRSAKKSDEKLFLTRQQFHKLGLLFDLKYIESKVSLVLLEKVEKTLDKESVIYTSEESQHVKEIIGISPSDIDKYLYTIMTIQEKKFYPELQKIFLGLSNNKCSVCHRMEYRFGYCNKHYEVYELTTIKNISYMLNRTQKNMYFIQIMKEKLSINMKNDETMYKTIQKDVNEYKNEYYKNVRDSTLDNTVVKFIDMVYESTVPNEKKFTNLINKCYKNIEYIEKDCIIINKNNIYNHNADMECRKLGKKILDILTKAKLSIINKIEYIYKNLDINNDNEKDPKNVVYDITNPVKIKNMLSKEEDKNSVNLFAMDLIKKIYGSKYKVINLSINESFDDNYYIPNITSLTYDVYGELYIGSMYIPFVINIKIHDKIKIENKIKDIYCVLHGIRYFYINIREADNMDEHIKFFFDKILSGI